MATQVNGYQKLLSQEYDTYTHWRDYALSHAVNVDWAFGNQCFDICALLWYQYGLRLETGNGYAYGCYALKKDVNARHPFIKVEHKTNIKKGDCIVFFASGLNYTGHICFADENYNGSDYIKCLGQNQGQGSGVGKASNIVNVSLKTFLGGFRNTSWGSDDPEPPVPSVTKKTTFPWTLYANRIKANRR